MSLLKNGIKGLCLICTVLIAASFTYAETARVTSRDGVLIHYVQKGKGDLALVFVHGWSCDATYWQDQMDWFSKTHRVVALDLAGHGKSGMGRKAYTIDAFGHDVAAVVDALKAEAVVLVGHSMGGTVIVNAHKKVSTRILGLIGADTFQANRNFTPEEQEGYLKIFEGDFKSGAQNFVGGMFPETADKAVVNRIVQDISRAPEAVAVSAMRHYLSHDHEREMGDVRTALMAINSDFWPTDVAALKKAVPGFTVKLMKGVSHFVAQEKPATFNRLLEECLKELIR